MVDKTTERRKIHISSAQNIGCREEQQDAFGIFKHGSSSGVNKGVFVIVADGMGGLANGSEVSGIVVESARFYFENVPFQRECSYNLADMVYHANEDAKSYLNQQTVGGIGGSTLVACYLYAGKLYFVSVGDSRIYLYRDGGMIQLNREQIQLRRLYELCSKGVISREEMLMDGQRWALTGYVGIPDVIQPDYNIEPLRIKRGDKVLLMSDGVFGTLSEREMCAVCKTSATIASDLERCVLGKNRSIQDNLTVVVLEID